MATNIPPHNLREVIDGVSPDRASRPADARTRASRRSCKAIPGPDFPTGGFIVGRARHLQRLHDRPRLASPSARKATTEEIEEGRSRLDRRHRDSRTRSTRSGCSRTSPSSCARRCIDGISDLRDESDRDGMRIVIELKRGEVPEVILNNLYKHTQLQTTFGIIMLAIVGGRPRVLPLARHHRALPRVPPRGRPPPHRVRAAQGRSARPHPRGPRRSRSITSTRSSS